MKWFCGLIRSTSVDKEASEKAGRGTAMLQAAPGAGSPVGESGFMGRVLPAGQGSRSEPRVGAGS